MNVEVCGKLYETRLTSIVVEITTVGSNKSFDCTIHVTCSKLFIIYSWQHALKGSTIKNKN